MGKLCHAKERKLFIKKKEVEYTSLPSSCLCTFVLWIKIYRRFGEICCQHHSIFSSAAAAAAAAAAAEDADDTRTSRSPGTPLLDHTVPVPEHSRLCCHSHKNIQSHSIKIHVNKGAVYGILYPFGSKFTDR